MLKQERSITEILGNKAARASPQELLWVLLLLQGFS